MCGTFPRAVLVHDLHRISDHMETISQAHRQLERFSRDLCPVKLERGQRVDRNGNVRVLNPRSDRNKCYSAIEVYKTS